jgi:hypothetical protein
MHDDECGAVGGMTGRGNRSTQRKPAPVPLCPPQIKRKQISLEETFIHRPVFYLKHNVSETEFSPRRQVEPTQLGPTVRATASVSGHQEVKVKVILRPTVSRRSVCPGVRPPSGPVTNFSFSLKFSLDSCGFVNL